ncbi:MAG: AMP-binding protein, partial [Gammaproteobacteria bacterium]|nr:AMP-binding protein [Gammaproteobacteria bacterium]
MKLSSLSLVTSAEERVISRQNDTSAAIDLDRNLIVLFNEWAATVPAAAACIDCRGEVSYGALNEQANQIAHYLISRGVETDVRVGLFFERSGEFLAGMLGILKAGGCYVPLDSQYPDDYVQQIIDDARPLLVLSSRTVGSRLHQPDGEVIYLDDPRIAQCATTDPAVQLHAEQLAYVMYTSGST